MPCFIVQEPHERADNQGDDGDIGEYAVAHIAQRNAGIGGLQRADGLRAGIYQADAVYQRLHAQRGDEGRHLQLGDDRAVDRADQRADGQHAQQHQRDGQIAQRRIELVGVVARALQKNGRQACGKACHAARAQVGALGNQAARHAQRDDEAHGGVGQQVAEVGLGEEIGAENAYQRRHQQDAHDDGAVADEAQHLAGGEAIPQILPQAQAFLLAALQRGQDQPRRQQRRAQNDQRHIDDGERAQRPGVKAKLLPQQPLVVDAPLRIVDALKLHLPDRAVLVLEELPAQRGEILIAQQEAVGLAVAVDIQLGISLGAPFHGGLGGGGRFGQLVRRDQHGYLFIDGRLLRGGNEMRLGYALQLRV